MGQEFFDLTSIVWAKAMAGVSVFNQNWFLNGQNYPDLRVVAIHISKLPKLAVYCTKLAFR